MKAFVQVNNEGEFYNPNGYNAWRGFGLLGYEVIKFQKNYAEITKETPVFAGVGSFRNILKHLDVNKPELPSYPDILWNFLGREVKTRTIAEFRDLVCQQKVPLFIKPLDSDRKMFNGHIALVGDDLRHTVSLPDDCLVLTSEVVKFVTEYRVFIHKGKILDARHYRGDYRRIIDFSVADAAVSLYKDAPVAYCLDFGLAEDGATLLVEVTDANSFGGYGLDSIYYGRMLVDRWEELVKPLDTR